MVTLAGGWHLATNQIPWQLEAAYGALGFGLALLWVGGKAVASAIAAALQAYAGRGGP